MVDKLVEIFVGHESGYQIVDKNLSFFQDTKIIYGRQIGRSMCVPRVWLPDSRQVFISFFYVLR